MRIHLIGIGGIGISGLARLYVARGHEISGTNDSESPITLDYLREKGVTITAPSIEAVPLDVDFFVYSNAWPTNFPEFMKEVEELGIPMKSYPQALGEVTKGYKTIAIAGAHGKTTTTAMLIHILKESGLSPTGIVGSLLSDSRSNFVEGDSDLFVIEAGEYKRAFLYYEPFMVGVTNIEEEHMDYYKNLADIQDAFREFAEKLPEDGVLVCSTLEQKSWDAFENLPRVVIDYSTVPTEDIKLKIPGQHNKQNAQLAIALARELGVEEAKAKKALESFLGTWRRSEFRGKTSKGALLYDDYAHHPTEIRATLAGFREMYPKNRIIVVFQPHLHSRTKDFFEDFAGSFKDVDEVVFAPIYTARAEEGQGVTSKMLAKRAEEKGAHACYIEEFEAIASHLNEHSQKDDILMTMGAGDIYEVIPLLS